MSAFLAVATERGMDATTMQMVAYAAGVNEVTLFRHFGSKATLALETVRHFSPASALRAMEPRVDVSSPAAAAESLFTCVRECHLLLQNHPALVRFGIAESHKMPDVSAESAAIGEAVVDFLHRCVAAAAPMLRPDADQRATVLQWMGLLTVTRLLAARDVLQEPSEEQWDHLLKAAVRVVIAWDSQPEGDGHDHR